MRPANWAISVQLSVLCACMGAAEGDVTQENVDDARTAREDARKAVDDARGNVDVKATDVATAIENHFLDALVGRTGGVPSTRFEVRGQFPILGIGDSTVYLGAIGNFGISESGEDVDDIIRVYLSWALGTGDLPKFLNRFTRPF